MTALNRRGWQLLKSKSVSLLRQTIRQVVSQFVRFIFGKASSCDKFGEIGAINAPRDIMAGRN